MRPDRVIVLLAAGLGSAALAALLTVRWRSETTEVDLADGRMRVTASVLGWTYAETGIDGGLDWVARFPPAGDPGERWVPCSVVSSGLLSGSAFSRRVGMVYVDALVMAGVVHAADASRLAAAVASIRGADPAAIWRIRGELREAFERGRRRR